MPHQYIKRNVGDEIQNGGVLSERINGRLWKIRCKCGNEFIAQPSYSSGLCMNCSRKEFALKRIKHGEAPHSGKNASRLYRIWLGMKVRCTNKRNHSYELYGERGISCCEEWNDYLKFKEWAIKNGYNDNLSIDRIDVNGNYTPENCRWVTLKEQGRNKRNNHLITFNGETKTMAEWAEITGIKYHTLKRRINNYGYSPEEALTLQVNAKRSKNY